MPLAKASAKEAPSLYLLGLLLGTDRRIGGARGFGVGLLEAKAADVNPLEEALKQLANWVSLNETTNDVGDVKQVEAILKNLFQSSNTRSTTSQQADPLMTRASTNSQATSSNITLGGNNGGR